MSLPKETSEKVLPILSKMDSLDGIIYVCPHCHRYVTAESGIKTCQKCGGKVDTDTQLRYEGSVKFDGEESWGKSKLNAITGDLLSGIM